MPKPAEETWTPYVQDPTWLPHAYDAQRDTLVFAHLPREAQRQLTFLDPRFMPREGQSAPAPISELAAEAVRHQAGPLHFIFHTGFCCSTLLARALDIPGVSMGIKEPSILASFAEHWSSKEHAPGAPEALNITLDLLSRPLARGEAQIVKPSTAVNHMIPQLLHARPDAKAIVLFSSLDAFLRAIVRRGLKGRVFARQLYYQFAPVIPLNGAVEEDYAILLADLQIAAQAWLMQAAFMDSLAKTFGTSRVRVLNGETLLANRMGTLSAVGAFFNLGLTPEITRSIVEGPVFKEHAKELGRPFSAEEHRAQHDHAGVMHHEELMMTKAWARALAIRSGAPLVLEETLRI